MEKVIATLVLLIVWLSIYILVLLWAVRGPIALGAITLPTRIVTAY